MTRIAGRMPSIQAAWRVAGLAGVAGGQGAYFGQVSMDFGAISRQGGVVLTALVAFVGRFTGICQT